MWIAQNNVLVRLPDDAPVPPDSSVLDVPPGFENDPAAYRLEKGRLIRRADSPQQKELPPKLTIEEISVVKAAIARGKLE